MNEIFSLTCSWTGAQHGHRVHLGVFNSEEKHAGRSVMCCLTGPGGRQGQRVSESACFKVRLHSQRWITNGRQDNGSSGFVVPVKIHRRTKQTNNQKKKPVHCTTVRSIQPRRCHCLCKAQLGSWWELGRAASQGITRVHTGDWKCSTFKKGLVSTSAGNKTVLFNFQIILSSDWQWCITHETRGFFKRASKARGRKPFSGRDYIDDNVALVNVPKLHPFGWLYKGGY